MYRRRQGGEATAARADADNNETQEQHTKRLTYELDFGSFAAHPRHLSYVRPYSAGELSAAIIGTLPRGCPTHVVVGFVRPRERVRLFLQHRTARGLQAHA